MSEINYKNLSEITVTTQAELDMIPDDFKGRIYIKSDVQIVVRKRYHWRVVAWGNSSVEARENSSVEAWGNSSVEARGNSSVEARENSSVEAWENSSVEAWGNSSVEARGNSSVEAWGNSSVVAWGNSSVEARGNSSVVAWGNSSVEARGNSSVVARENSSVVARENSSVVATANAQIVDRQINGTIQISGNARIVYMPKTIHEFMDFYGIKHTKTKATFYKAVRKQNDGRLLSDYDRSFEYKVDETKSEKCDPDTHRECSYGIHISHLDWALRFGSDWDNLAIIECETKISDIVMPDNTDGKVRTSKIKVLREVPLEECGVYGKILAKRLRR